MKKIWVLLVIVLLAGCVPAGIGEAEKPVVIATIFPQYDFARRIAGDRIELSMLLSPGAEAHSYEPTPKDMIALERADLLIATSPEMEPWAFRLSDASGVFVLAATEGIALIEGEEDEHDHDHDHRLDPHVWTDPLLALEMARNIARALSEIDPDGAQVYRENFDAFAAELTALDGAFMDARAGAKRNILAFGSRFSFGYFVRRYDIEAVSAYASCAEGADPSVKMMKELVDLIVQKELPVVYYEALNDRKVAETLAFESGAVLLPIHSLHTVSPEQFLSGATYLDLMKENLEAFKEGIG